MTKNRFFQIWQAQPEQIREELLDGLHAYPPTTSPKYLYDELGSKLFEAITCIPEYYPTRTEAAIFRDCGEAMSKCIPQAARFIDLGAGNCAKAASLFQSFNPSTYVAVDISVEFLRGALECLQRQFPALEMIGVGTDFSSELALPQEALGDEKEPRVVFYPGSSIGNFDPQHASQFLAQIHRQCGSNPSSGLLIGVDLVKPAEVLVPAYDDALGVTAAFNKNLLLHINRLTGTDFNIDQWSHIGLFNTGTSRIEMHLEAKQALTVHTPRGALNFAKGERIHTENSYKWTLQGFEALLRNAGFSTCRHWTDPQQWFGVFWAQV